MSYTVLQIREIISADLLLNEDPLAVIDHLLLDSRKLLFPATSLFFGLSGLRRNGHLFIAELYDKGVRNFVIDETLSSKDLKEYSGSNFLLVNNVQQALHALVAYHRSQFKIPVIGITGSNGKTIVKEWLYQLLQADYNIVRNPKSYNSQIGVPLSVWQMNKTHTLAIFEAGISQPNEMVLLEKIIRPTIGVLTNIGEAHNEGFTNISQKINEKITLFSNAEVVICTADNVAIIDAVESLNNKLNTVIHPQIFSWGNNSASTLVIISIQKNNDNTVICADHHQPNKIISGVTITIPFTDNAAIENAITCWCVLLQLKVPSTEIATRMLHLRTVEMRLELKQGVNNCSIINDSYSADINSLTIALDFLVQQQQHTNRTLILSDILQSGKSSGQLYEEIAAILQQKNINRLIGIGPEIYKYQMLFKNIAQHYFYTSLAEFMQQYHALNFNNETILLKGARIFEFEQISHLLEEKVHQTVLEIDLNAITHNLKTYQQILKPGVKLMAMVKAFSYGSGGFEIANLLQFHKVDFLAVAYADEGVQLRKAGITLPILVLNPEQATFDVIVQFDLEPELYSFSILNLFFQYLQRSGIKNYPVHIKLDTGMHRLGFTAKDMEALSDLLKMYDEFKIRSVFSHLAASDDPAQDDFTTHQADEFVKGCNQLQHALGYTFIRHIANTSSIHRHADLQFDMVRLGIGLYGVDSNAGMQEKLKNVSTLKTTISQIKNLMPGESVGYNRKGVVKKQSAIATVRIGYADGYPRILSNGVGKMYVNGKLVPVIGTVCMDMTMLDITDADVKEGDEVIVFGENLPVKDVAIWAQTITYEILTGISQRVKRVYYEA